MFDHEQSETALAIRENKKLTFPVHESNKSRFSGKLRYWWCWAVAGVLLLIVGIPSLIVLGLINKKMWIYPIARWGGDLWLSACGAKVKVSGLEHLPDEESFVFISNHRSYLDTATLFFYTGKKIGLVAKKELLKVPVLGQGMHYVNIFAIDRSNPEKARKSMEKARRVMESGSSFGVFAEGTRAMPGELLPFKKGAFHLAMQTNSRIVPVAIRNTDWMMGKKQGVAYPGIIEMVLLSPVETAGRELMDILVETRGAIARELQLKN
ncbi:lysophospholipid acyltransferase family protein [Leptolyngbya sp. 7M]|uniref:lysophospholipid acyltransferase family protein n=1 Tax=Leptolyngbya sp. 7M TaxID=2812896 RepID=UPI001B8B0C1E|nr:lysophospholipid acyltransferase family protein [Leptolyngbya sp. 7M]QYO67992.1 1-acyl-sn-glycerol-3-phosphate acyltransferase [Leptolyngbya sp. 7M]